MDYFFFQYYFYIYISLSHLYTKCQNNKITKLKITQKVNELL